MNFQVYKYTSKRFYEELILPRPCFDFVKYRNAFDQNNWYIYYCLHFEPSNNLPSFFRQIPDFSQITLWHSQSVLNF